MGCSLLSLSCGGWRVLAKRSRHPFANYITIGHDDE